MSVPITKGNYSSNETYLYTYLIGEGLNKAAACGILANISKESNFNTTAVGDSGQSYGLCQWYKERKTKLINYCQKNKLNYTTISGQSKYLIYELKNDYPTVWNYMKGVSNTSEGSYDAAYYFCYNFEIPANKASVSKSRGELAKNTYWSAYSNSSTKTNPVENKGNLIVQEAKKHIGKPYIWGAQGPNSFDCSGFIYYVYKKAINLNWSRLTAYGQYNYKDAKVVKGDWKAGDLVYFTNTYQTGRNPNISHIAIATGNGDEIIHAGSSTGVQQISMSDSPSLNNKYYATKRIVADSETSSGNSEYNPSSPSNNNTLYNDLLLSGARYSEDSDRYLNDMLSARDSVRTKNKSSKQDYGYLVDLTNGGEFKFIVPEYGVDVKANWDSTNIIGRSAEILSYSSTSSKAIDISLELIAGAGLYTGKGDRVAAMHKDIAFVQSLEYPDYSKAIVFPPSVVYLYLNEVTQLRGVVDSVSAKYKKPYDIMNRPMMAELSFKVLQVSENPPDYSDIRGYKDNSY